MTPLPEDKRWEEIRKIRSEYRTEPVRAGYKPQDRGLTSLNQIGCALWALVEEIRLLRQQLTGEGEQNGIR